MAQKMLRKTVLDWGYFVETIWILRLSPHFWPPYPPLLLIFPVNSQKLPWF